MVRCAPERADSLAVEFSSPTGSEFLSLAAVGDRTGHASRLALRVEVHLHGFGARCESSVERRALARFVLALRSLDATWKGVAALHGDGPADLEVRISGVGRGGRMHVEFRVTHRPAAGRGDRPVQLAGAFEVSPVLLSGVLARLDGLTSAATARC